MFWGRTRRWVGVELILLRLAVFPADVYMTHAAVVAQGWRALYTVGAVARRPLQFVRIGLVWGESSQKRTTPSIRLGDGAPGP